MKDQLKVLLKRIGVYTIAHEKKLFKLEKELKTITHSSNGKKILFAQSFSIYDPCFIHDKLMAYTFKLRGFEIVATYCDGIQKKECNVFGGAWGGEKKFEDNCKVCQKMSDNQWSFLSKESIYKYSKYLNADDYKKVDLAVNSLGPDQWLKYTEDGWNIGAWAKDILVNNYVVGDYKLVDDHEALGRTHLKNLLLNKISCERIIKAVNPDRIIANDSYYGMWKIWELLAKKYSIPFYSHWSGTRIGAWCYAHNDASMHLDFSKSWPNYSKKELSGDEKERVEKWLNNRVSGKDMILDTASLASFKNEQFNFLDIDKNKPTALLSANVIWDLAALNKEIFHTSMSEWIIETIKWFALHPEYQLIVKAHPAESHPTIPQTKETVSSIIQSEFKEIPKNIFILSAKVSLSVYDFFPVSNLGLVFTTSVGMEMAARGVPVITSGSSHYRGYGFTLDPKTKIEYFEFIEQVLSGRKELNIEATKDLAKKFIKFNFFHYYSKTNLIEFSFGVNKKSVIDINIEHIDELKKGNNKHFDYIVKCIENGEAILSENSWPAES